MIESKYLKDNIENIQKLMAISALRNFETKSLGKLLKLSKIREYDDGEAIIREGDSDPWLYFLLSGKVRISKQGLEIGVIDKRAIFSERCASSTAWAGRPPPRPWENGLSGRGHRRRRPFQHQHPSGGKLDFLLLLYRIFAEYMAVRLRATNEELIAAKKKIKHLISKL
jgi:CRP/FNR family transcriptional regulator, cyclic AMP receptor protein